MAELGQRVALGMGGQELALIWLGHGQVAADVLPDHEGGLGAVRAGRPVAVAPRELGRSQAAVRVVPAYEAQAGVTGVPAGYPEEVAGLEEDAGPRRLVEERSPGNGQAFGNSVVLVPCWEVADGRVDELVEVGAANEVREALLQADDPLGGRVPGHAVLLV